MEKHWKHSNKENKINSNHILLYWGIKEENFLDNVEIKNNVYYLFFIPFVIIKEEIISSNKDAHIVVDMGVLIYKHFNDINFSTI